MQTSFDPGISGRISHQPRRKRIGPGRDGPGTKTDENIARAGLLTAKPHEISLVDHRAGMAMAMGDQARDQIVTAGA
jgi:hypothetical protein